MAKKAAPDARPSSSRDENLGERIGEATRRQELAHPDAGLDPLNRAINRVAEVVGVLVLAVIVGTIFCNAFGRYVFSAHLLWAEELVLLLLPWLAMTGTFLAVRRGTMIRIEYFYDRLPYPLRRPLALFGYALCVAALGFLGVVSTRFVKLFGSDPSPYLDIATGWSTIALVIGGFAVAAAFLAVLLRELSELARGAR